MKIYIVLAENFSRDFETIEVFRYSKDAKAFL